MDDQAEIKPSNQDKTNQISPFVILLFAKAIAECTVQLQWIKENNMLTMTKTVNKIR